MLIPSIDLMGGRIVQLLGGSELKLAFDDFEPWITRFEKYSMVQLIDLDAAMRQGSNSVLVSTISRRLPCQVGGGIHTLERAFEVLASGAHRVILGSALFQSQVDGRSDAKGAELVRTGFAHELAQAIGPERLVFSVDTRAGRVAVKGWKEQVDLSPEQAMAALEPYCSAFLYTHIDREGSMQGFPFEVAARLRSATQRQLIVAGGIRHADEVAALDNMGVDAVAGMAIYQGQLAV